MSIVKYRKCRNTIERSANQATNCRSFDKWLFELKQWEEGCKVTLSCFSEMLQSIMDNMTGGYEAVWMIFLT